MILGYLEIYLTINGEDNQYEKKVSIEITL